MISVNLVFEDEPSGTLLGKLIAEQPSLRIAVPMKAGGIGNIKRNILKYNEASRVVPVIILADLDSTDCAPSMVADWMGGRSRNPGCVLRVVVREIEAWIIADQDRFAGHFGVPRAKLPLDVETIRDPKQFLVNLARRSTKKRIRNGIPPSRDSTAQVGHEYNDILCEFIEEHWRVDAARSCSRSLDRAIQAIRELVRWSPTIS